MISTKTNRRETRMAIKTDPLWMPGPAVPMTMPSPKSVHVQSPARHIVRQVARRVRKRVHVGPIRPREVFPNLDAQSAPSDRDHRHRLSRLHPVASARSSMTMSTAWSSPFTNVTPSPCLACWRQSRWACCSECSTPSYAPPRPRNHSRFRLHPQQRSLRHLRHQAPGPARPLDRALLPIGRSDL